MKTTRWSARLGGGLLLLMACASSAMAARAWTYTYHPDTEGPYGTIPGQIATADGPRTDVADITSYDYDAQGNLIRTTNALGHVSQITAHDAAGRPLTLVDPNGVTTALTYDARGRLTSRTTAGATTSFGYDGVGNLTSVTLPTGTTLTYHYDGARRLTAIEDSLGNRIDYTLDAAGNRTEQQIRDASGLLRYAKTQVFDELSRLRQVVGLDGSHSLHYDANGNLTREIDGRANATAHAFDPLNRLERTTDALAGQTLYSYDGQDRLAAVTDPKGNTTQYVYNGLGDLVQQISPDTGTTTYTYDAAGNRLSQTDANGQVIEYRYDSLNRLTQILYPADPGQNVSFHYDDPNSTYGIGRLTGLSGPNSSIRYGYTARGLLASATQSIGGYAYSIGYSYDQAEQLVAITYPSGRVVSYQRNSAGQIERVSSTQGGITQTLASNLGYAPFGPLTSLTYGNGLLLARTLDPNYRLSHISVGQILGRDYGFYGNDDIARIGKEDGSTQSFDYDPLRRLSQAQDVSVSWSWSYDANGNRLSEQRNSAFDSYSLESHSNRLVAIDGGTSASYSYDANGNVLAKGSLAFSYDPYNRLLSVSDNGQVVGQYQYNALNQRIEKTVVGAQTLSQASGDEALARLNAQLDRVPERVRPWLRALLQEHLSGQTGQRQAGQGQAAKTGKAATTGATTTAPTTVHFVYDQQGQLLAEIDAGSGQTLIEYVWLDNLPLAAIHSNTATPGTYYVHADHLNTPQVVSDAQGHVVWQASYSPFGQAQVTQSTIPFNLRFPGQYFDQETGLHYNWHRYYDPQTGRYITSDPIGLEGGLNTYAYVGGNPISQIDPTGTICIRLPNGMEYCDGVFDDAPHTLKRPPSCCDQPKLRECLLNQAGGLGLDCALCVLSRGGDRPSCASCASSSATAAACFLEHCGTEKCDCEP